MVARGEPIIGGGAGTGLSAKSEEAGGIDLIVIYNSGRYRMAGRGSPAGLLAYGNANEIVKEMALEVLPVVKQTPVLAGVNGTDPFVLMPQFLAELKAMGFSGVQNFPTIGLFDGVMRQSLRGDRHGLRARGRHDRRGAPAGPADHALCVQPGRGDGDDAGRGRHRRGAYGRDDGRRDRRDVGQDARRTASPRSRRSPRRRGSVREDVLVLCHGGPIAMPEDARYVLERVHGRATASMAPARWSGCRSRWRSRGRSRGSRG